MANIASAKKRARQAEKRRLNNKIQRSRAVTRLKQARRAVVLAHAKATSKNKAGSKTVIKPDQEQISKAQNACKQAMASLDRMAAKGIFPKNRTARLKSRLNTALKQFCNN